MSNTKKSKTVNIPTGCGKINITLIPGDECFIKKGKSGGCVNGLIEAISRLSGELIRDGKLDKVIEHLVEIKCPNQQHHDGSVILSCPDAIAKALIKLKENLDEP